MRLLCHARSTQNEFGQLNSSYAHGWKWHALALSLNVRLGNKVDIHNFLNV